jgi:hypothetical protein
MTEVPDTGPGLSGFLAHVLWIPFQYFPSSGRFDWLILFVLLAGGANLLFLPHLWRAVRADIVCLQNGAPTTGPYQFTVILWGLIWLFFLTWLFSTPAGETFLTGRAVPFAGPIAHLHDRLVPVVAVGCLAVMAVFGAASFFLFVRHRDGTSTSRPFRRRTLLALYAGGGIYVGPSRQGLRPLPVVPPAGYWALFILILCGFLGSRAPAAIPLLGCFLLVGLGMEAVRCLFVFLWHRRAFG